MSGTGAQCCGATKLPDGAICWRVWAPRARSVDLVLSDAGPTAMRHVIPMTPQEYGHFEHVTDSIPEGQRYAFRLDGGPDRPDPASYWQPDGVHRPSAVLFPERFVWTDQSWHGVERNDLVIYELHVGAFTAEGTFDAIVPRLDALRDLGISAIELMPVAQFPGTRNWGYDGVHLHAPQNSYGGPHGLQRLVDACHAAGLAIILDVVYNHLGPEGNYLNEFGPYFTDRYRTPWGTAVNFDGAGCDSVRDLVLENVRLWLDTYHCDGLRLDAVHAIYDLGPRHILRAIKDTAEQIAARTGRRIHIIAESNLNDVRLLQAPEAGGHGLDAQWHDDFHHAVHTYLTGERHGYYVDFGAAQDFPKLFKKTFLLDGVYSQFHARRHGAPVGDLPGDRFVVSIQNHDQVGNRAAGDRLSTLLAPPAQRLAASMMLLAPHVPMLFMGEEYGETNPFPFFCSFEDGQLIENVRAGRRREFAEFGWQGEVPDPQAEGTFAYARLTWSWPDQSAQAGLRRLYRDLLHARRAWPGLSDFRVHSARLLPESDDSVLEITRGVDSMDALHMLFNLTDTIKAVARLPGHEGVLFCSEAKKYGGPREPASSISELNPFECVVFGSVRGLSAAPP